MFSKSQTDALALLDQYFSTTPEHIIKADVQAVSAFNFAGSSAKDYFASFHTYLYYEPFKKNNKITNFVKYFQMNLQFDIRGNLQAPPDFIEMGWTDFKTYFVDNQPIDSTRKRIFEGFELFLNELEQLWQKPFILWINGSFCSQKSNPNDVDVLIEVEYGNNDAEIVVIQQMIRQFRIERHLLVDCYVLVRYAATHPLHSWYQSDYVYWLNQWGFTQPNRRKQKFRKGIIRLNFEK
jgi:hypothetical protein